ncbi:MAG: hypothetical protein E7397_08110 [Ruminococcaceae bacterium]|nr:hypothetical protein [Oscillospiraceae bacterium]
MLMIEIIEGKYTLRSYLSGYRNQDDSVIIGADYDSIIEKLTENDRTRWYAIKYSGKIENMKQELSIIREINYPKYFLHISMKEPLLNDVSAVMQEFAEINKCEEPDGEVYVTTEEVLSPEELEVLIVAPEYELGWKFHQLFHGK